MSDNPFEHDDAAFDGSEAPNAIGISEAESKYAEICSGILASGSMNPSKRARLGSEADLLGVEAERASRIEASLLVHQQADAATAPATFSGGEGPFAAAKEPHVDLLQQRIERLESENGAVRQAHAGSEAENRLLGEHIERLEALVAQLQFALGSTLTELDTTREELDEVREAANPKVPEPTASLVQQAGEHSKNEAEAAKRQALETTPDPSQDGALSAATSSPGRRTFQPRPHRSRRLLQTITNEAPPAPVTATQTEALADKSSQVDVDWASDVLAVGARPRLHSERLRDDPAEIHRCLRSQPRDADLLHALFGALQRGDDLDRRWCIAHALSYLGEANQQELDLYHAHRAEGLIRPTRAVNEDEWFELLSHPDEDLLTSRILAEIAPTMLLGAIPALRESIAPSLVNPEEKVDLQNSTLQAGRCIGWAARILGIDAPTIYASPSWQGTIDMVLTPRPCSRLGGSMLSGRSNAELAFFAGRHLCWYRREHVLARPRQVRRALDDMFLVGLIIGNPGLPLKASIRERISPMAAAVRKLLDSAAINRLAGLFRDFVARGGKTNLNDWVVGVERTAACSGLLLCNDLQAAEAAVGLDTREPQAVMDELVLFHTAGRCTMLRKRIGVAIAGSSSR